MKICGKCKLAKSKDEFVKNKNTKDGLSWDCKPCHQMQTRLSREKAGGSRYYHLKRRYGITKEEYEQLLEKQENKCAICGKQDPYHLDHEHVGREEIGKMGNVRGILCTACNNGLGLFRDNAETLRKAADYLDK